jgi:hypothetical protein
LRSQESRRRPCRPLTFDEKFARVIARRSAPRIELGRPSRNFAARLVVALVSIAGSASVVLRS